MLLARPLWLPTLAVALFVGAPASALEAWPWLVASPVAPWGGIAPSPFGVTNAGQGEAEEDPVDEKKEPPVEKGEDPDDDEESSDDDADKDEDADEDADEQEDAEKKDDAEKDDAEKDDADEEEDDSSDTEEAVPLTIETLTSIDWRKGDELPDEITKYDGKLVKISGYMATGTELDATEFELVPQNCECGKSKVNHFVKVIIEDGGAEFDPARVQFTGRLEIGEEEEDGFVTSLYRLTIESFDPEEPDADTAVRGPAF